MGTHPIFESDFDCLTDKMKLIVLTAVLQVTVALHKSFGSDSFAPIQHETVFPDAHNSGKKKNVWKKTVGKTSPKSGILAYKDKAFSFVKKQYASYMKNISIEKIIATQIAAV